MKLGIFGDSFADNGNNNEWSWMHLLGKKLHVEPDLHGRSATSLFYSYQLFLKNHSKYDTIVFMVTQPGRYPAGIPSPKYDFPIYIAGIQNLEQAKLLNRVDLTTYKNLISYFLMQSDQFEYTAHKLMIFDILRLRPDVILIPAFPWEDKSEEFNDLNKIFDNILPGGIIQFTNIQQNLMNDKRCSNVSQLETSNICCHFTKEYNTALAKVIYNRIQTGIWDWSPMHNIASIDTTKDYYLPVGETRDE